MNNLAFVGKIMSTTPIEGADRIHAAEVVCGVGGRWSGVVPKTINVEDRVVVFTQDSILPELPEYEFMRTRGFRVRMSRFKGAKSECLILPWTGPEPVGTDVTEQLGVIKYTKELPVTMSGEAKGLFPGFLRRTDEPNMQRARDLVDKLIGQPFVITLKYDGTSCTVYKHNGEFGVCSRNYDLKRGSGLYWAVVEQYDLENMFPDNVAIQFEIIGPGIQKNPAKTENREIRVFDMWSLKPNIRLAHHGAAFIADKWGLPFAKVLKLGECFNPEEIETIMKEQCFYAAGIPAEGIVVRSQSDPYTSFKVINLDYKD